ncbi:MAG: hypothetical protein JWM93_3978 [Frankiales bacterium]|nr:hypothetical protein [Frankiales bacterium]
MMVTWLLRFRRAALLPDGVTGASGSKAQPRLAAALPGAETDHRASPRRKGPGDDEGPDAHVGIRVLLHAFCDGCPPGSSTAAAPVGSSFPLELVEIEQLAAVRVDMGDRDVAAIPPRVDGLLRELQDDRSLRDRDQRPAHGRPRTCRALAACTPTLQLRNRLHHSCSGLRWCTCSAVGQGATSSQWSHTTTPKPASTMTTCTDQAAGSVGCWASSAGLTRVRDRASWLRILLTFTVRSPSPPAGRAGLAGVADHAARRDLVVLFRG